MREAPQLASLQRELLDSLEAEDSIERTRARIAAHDPEWAALLRQDAVRVATKLVKRWTVHGAR